MKKLIITGATGMIGMELLKVLSNNYHIIIVTRNINKAKNLTGNKFEYITWNEELKFIEAMENAHGVINLAGENIGKKRWTRNEKNKILTSRIYAGRVLSSVIDKTNNKPEIFIQASAIGYYTSHTDIEYTEKSKVATTSFIQKVCHQWENSTKENVKYNIRHVVIRIGLVMHKKNGVFKKVYNQFKLFAGGNLGDGNQWISWIHITDVVNAIKFIIENHNASGIYNIVSPQPVRYKQFAKLMANYQKRPLWFNIPGFLLMIIFGQMAKETILVSLKVKPESLIKLGYRFLYPNIKNVFENEIN